MVYGFTPHPFGWSEGEDSRASVGGLCVQPKLTEPTPEMLAFYEHRTNDHIERVRRCLTLLAEGTEYGEALIERAAVHDASKFGDEERIPYVWLTEYHRCRRRGEPFEYPQGVAEAVKLAIRHHLTSNRHHPEFHADPNDMADVDLIEMVCDWTAMAQEFGEGSGTRLGGQNHRASCRVQRGETAVRLSDDRGVG